MSLPGEVKALGDNPAFFYLCIPGHIFVFNRDHFIHLYPNSILTQALLEQPGDMVTIDLMNPMFTPEALSWIWQFTQGATIPETAPERMAEIGRYLNIDFFGAVSGPDYEQFAMINPNLALLKFSDLEDPENYRWVLRYALQYNFPGLALYTFSATDPFRHSLDDARFLVVASYMGNLPIVNAILTSRRPDLKAARITANQWPNYSTEYISPFLLEDRFEGKKGSLALYLAILQRRPEIIRRLLLDERITSTLDPVLTAQLAIDTQNLPLLESLLPEVDVETNGYELLHYAIFTHNPDAIKLLLPYTDPTVNDNALFMMAVDQHLPDSLQALLTDPRVKDWTGKGLEHAIVFGFNDIVDLLLEKKAELQIANEVFAAAQAKGDADLIQRLLNYTPE